MSKVVDATKGKVTVAGATLSVVDLRGVFKSPNEDEELPYWIAELELSNDGDKITSARVRIPYVEGKDPIKEAYKAVKAEDLNGWTVTRFVDGLDPVRASLRVTYSILTG